MPTYTVRAPNGKTYRVEGPPGATQKQVEEAVLKAHPEAAGTGRVPKEGALGKVETAGMGLTRGIDEAIFGTGRLIGQGLEYVGATNLGGKLRAASERELAESRAQYEPFLRANPRTAEGGRIVGNIIGLAAPGGAVSKPLQVVSKVAPKLAPVTTALRTSGMATGVKATTPVAKAVDAALRIGGGATAGAASSAVLDQALDEGATVGAAVSLIPLVGRYGAGPVWDVVRGRFGEARAARIFRQALGANIDAAKAAFAKGGKGTASQVLARMGIDADTFFATGEIVAKSSDSTGLLDDIAKGQRAAQRQTLAAASGATTRTGGRRAAEVQRRLTTQQAEPIMQQSLEGANAGTKNVFAAQQQAAAGRQAAATEAQTAKRLLGGAENQATVLGQMDDLGDVLDISAINRQRGIVGGLEQRGGQAAERSLAAGQQARTAEQRLAELQAAGVEPLDASALSARFRQMGAAERANPERAAIFNGFADEVDRLAAENGGILDAFDLYEIRKDAGAFVERALQGRATPEAMRKRTAELVGATRPVIDKAIRSAGGARWGEYLDTFSTGMDEARRIELADYARSLYEKQPAQFEALMRGDRPDVVERFFGKGRDDINEVMGPKVLELQGPTKPGQLLTAQPPGPSRMPAMQDVAKDLEIETFIKNSMTPGSRARAAALTAPPVNALAEFGRTVPFGFGGFIERPAVLYQERLADPAVMRLLERGFATPQGAAELLNYIPSGQRSINFLEGLSPATLRILQQSGVQSAREEPEYVNMMRR